MLYMTIVGYLSTYSNYGSFAGVFYIWQLCSIVLYIAIMGHWLMYKVYGNGGAFAYKYQL